MIVILQLAVFFAAVMIGGIAGFIGERLLRASLRRAAVRTPWIETDALIRPWRRRLALWGAVVGALAALESLPLEPNIQRIARVLLLVGLILSMTIASAGVVNHLVSGYVRRADGRLPATSIFTKVPTIIVFIIGVLILLQSLDIAITPILTTLGVAGLAVALALQDTLSNFFAGIYIILSRKLHPGDYVRLTTGEEGYITDIDLRNTTIRELSNNMIIVPNAKLSAEIVRNHALPEREMAVLIDVGVSYDSNLDTVERITIEVAKTTLEETPGGVPEFEPFIRYNTFGEFSIRFTVILRASEFVDQYLIKHEFIKRLHRRYRDEGIEIPLPIRSIYMRNSSRQANSRYKIEREHEV